MPKNSLPSHLHPLLFQILVISATTKVILTTEEEITATTKVILASEEVITATLQIMSATK